MSDAPFEHDPSWPVVSLAAITSKIGSGATPTGGGSTYLPSRQHFALVRSQNVLDRGFDLSGLAFISDEQAGGLRSAALQPGDILLNITGDGITFGRSCLAPAAVLPACVNQHVSIVRLDARLADPGYVLSYFTHPAVKSYIDSFNAGGSRRAITKGHIESFRIPLPPLTRQRRIAEILGALDDKIELNRRMTETLEATARAMFGSWFVRFDPVRANAEGRDPGMSTELATLFPAALADSEIGSVPEGWRVARLGDETTTLLGGTPARDNLAYWGGDIPWINSGKANDFRVVEPSEFISTAGLESSATKLLPARTTIIAITGATLGQVSLTEIDTCANQSIVGVLGSDALPSEYLYFWIKERVVDLVAAQTGGAQQHVNKNDVNRLRVLCPPTDAMDAYTAVARPIFDRVREACLQSLLLRSARDALLPNLLSGELRVDDAQQVVEAASA